MKLNAMVEATSGKEPKSYASAMKAPDAEEWKKAIQEEYDALIRNGTWTEVNRDTILKGTKIHRPIWRFKRKLDGRYKARLCFDGRFQSFGEDVWDSTSPVPGLEIIKSALTIMLSKFENIAQADVPNAF